jgi:hypothetical protein
MSPKQRKARLDRQVAEIVQRRCAGLQINIMDIHKVFEAAYAADSGVTGQDVEAAVYLTYKSLAEAV